MRSKKIQRGAIILALFGLLLIAAQIKPLDFMLFAVGMLVSIIPAFMLLFFTALIASSAVKVFSRSRLLRASLLVLLIYQEVILFSWTEGWTVASAFDKSSSELGWPVIDPQLENALMMAFWLLAAFVFAMTIEHLLNCRFKLRMGSFDRASFRKKALILVCEALLLSSLNSGVVSFRRVSRDVRIASSVSADGAREARVVPLNAWIDTNGLVIARRPKSIIWRTIGTIGDSLTEAEGGRFVWSDDGSKVYLLLNYYQEQDFPILGFDFAANKAIDPKSYATPQ
ncbi:MAG TPA: hypothetical protein VGC89_04260 [Pyrinomonadaceae bacterium]